MRTEANERAPTLSLTQAALEFEVSRDTLKRKLERSGAREEPDGRWSAAEVAWALHGPRTGPEVGAAVLARRKLRPLCNGLEALAAMRLPKPARDQLAALLELAAAP